MTPSLDSEIQEQWDSLLQTTRRRTFYLTAEGRLQHSAGTYEVGTFDSRISLADFRESVFWSYEQLRRARRGS